LYNLATDPDESYDIAPANPQIVSQIQTKIAGMIKDFPEQVRTAFEDAQKRKADPTTPVGAYPKPVPQ
jgi:arylsulfatase